MKEIDRLRSLLGLDGDRERLDAVRRRVDRRDKRTKDVAEVLPEAMDQALAEGQLGQTLSKPVESAIHESIAKDPKRFADILYPIMGPAIRKSIAEAMRSMMQGINEAVQQSPFSPQGLRWRLEAARTGLPLREVILRHTLAYRVRQVFLLQSDSGLLLAHASDDNEQGLDEDAVGAMLTAIQDFVRDSVGDADAGLSSAELGAHTMWAIPGPVTQLGVIVDGHPPVQVRVRLREKLEQMHGLFHSWMEDFDGSAETPPELQQLVDECLISVSKSELVRNQVEQKKASSWRRWGVLGGVAVLCLLAWWGWNWWQNHLESRTIAAIKSRFESTPGLVLIDTDRDGDETVLRALADPLAEPPERLLQGLRLIKPVRFQVEPYQSLDPVLSGRRLLNQLEVPESIDVKQSEGMIQLSGSADFGWIAQLRRGLTRDASAAIEFDQVQESQSSLVERARAALTPPDSLTLTSDDATVVISGVASSQWLGEARRRLPSLESLVVDLSGVRSSDLSQLIGEIEQITIPFQAGAEPTPRALESLQQLAAQLKQFKQQLEAEQRSAKIVLAGRTDGTGSPIANAQLRLARAEMARKQLIELGVEPDFLVASSGQAIDTSLRSDRQFRRVEVRVELAEVQR